MAQKPAPEPPPAPPSDADLNKAIADFAAGRISASDLEAALAGEPITPPSGDGQQQPGTPSDPAPVMPEVTRRTIEAANAALAQIPGGPKTAPYQGPLRYVGTDWDGVIAASTTNAMIANILRNDFPSARPALLDNRLFQRATRLEQIPPQSVASSVAAAPADRRELFALAMADADMMNRLMQLGTMRAAHARVQNDQTLIDECVELLNQANAFVPLQRSGWTAYSADIPIPPDGDGVWLATGWGLTAITEMCTTLGARVPQDLIDRLELQVRAEVLRICEDWRDKKPWYVKSRNSVTNQWIEPSLGLIRACLFLGDPALSPAYNLGIENLIESLVSHGSTGEFLEGMAYANMTLGSLHEVVALTRLSGDDRLASSGFGSNNWKWFAQMHLPGGYFINCYDCVLGKVPLYALDTPLGSFANAALSVGPTSTQFMRSIYPSPVAVNSLHALRYASAVASGSQGDGGSSSLQPYAYFPKQELVVWRSGFQRVAGPQTAWALWAKGGQVNESHVQRDQGHVTIVVGNRLVISNCGTPPYGTPQFEQNFSGVSGKNVMQIGALSPAGTPVHAPLFVNALGQAGGQVEIDVSAVYPGSTCTRNISWDSGGSVRIIDNVSLPSTAASGTEVYRFHTGSLVPLNISGSDKEWDVTWNGTSVHFSADSAIEVDQVTSPNAIQPPNQHQTIRIKTKNGTSMLQLVSDFVIDLSVTQ